MSLKCDVCGSDSVARVFASRCGPVSFAYCKDCSKNEAEPYKALVAYLSNAVLSGDDLRPEKNQVNPLYSTIIDSSLKVANKTHEQFYQDVDKAIEEDKKYWRSITDKEEWG